MSTRLFILALACIGLFGCVQSAKPLLDTRNAATPLPEHYLLAHENERVSGSLVGNEYVFVDDDQSKSVSFHAIPGHDNLYIAQLIPIDTSEIIYTLTRVTPAKLAIFVDGYTSLASANVLSGITVDEPGKYATITATSRDSLMQLMSLAAATLDSPSPESPTVEYEVYELKNPLDAMRTK